MADCGESGRGSWAKRRPRWDSNRSLKAWARLQTRNPDKIYTAEVTSQPYDERGLSEGPGTNSPIAERRRPPVACRSEI